MTARPAGFAVASVLAADALVHLYWATGATWPARDPAALSLAVLNVEVPFTPRTLLPLVALLLAGSALMLARVTRPDPGRLLRLVPLAVAAGLAARSLAGLGWALGIGADRASLFYVLNLALYTPVCLALLAATVVVLRSGRAPLSALRAG